ncbi:MAG: hypothetical protein EXX96DRAFT_583494 [Benjaminiella poitrasii]|nr:MAG: hypothetical protein EXX96DRAFT_583494 [Benjaminiella poitrasii]
MSESTKRIDIPTVNINNIPVSGSIPLTTEEPVRREWLKTELEDINKDDEPAAEVAASEATEEEGSWTGTEEESDEDSTTGQNKIKNIEAAGEDEEEKEEPEVKKVEEESKRPAGHQRQASDDSFHANDIMAYMRREMEEYQERQDDETAEYEQRVAEAETEDDILEADPELLRRTESNRHIPYDESAAPHPPERSNSILADPAQKELLVFADNPAVIEDTNKLCVIHYYGAGKSGILPASYRTKRKPKAYLVAYDFSKESLYAIEWTMGTMMRDGDELHIATISNREDNPDIVKTTGLDPKGELHLTSDALIAEAKELLGQMLLFNIKLVTHVMIGRVKDCLKSLTRENNFTMLVCGSRGRSSMRK